MDRLACPDLTPPEYREATYQLRLVDMSDVTIEYLGSFPCEVAAGLAFSRKLNILSGEPGDPCKLQILEEGKIIEERYVS